MLAPNTQIGSRYQVIRLLGQGGMSNLYLCRDRRRGDQTCVIKEMTASYSDPKEQELALQLFHREAKLLASLNHRHIPKVYDYFQMRGKYYLAMEYVDGEDLGQMLQRNPSPLPEKQVTTWAVQLATVLYYLHVHKPPIVFRDVKPSNVMITRAGVKLIDFGIARHFDAAKKGDTMRIGSPGYAPPEQYSGQTDPRSDIYALGVTLHHALTGRDPTTTQTPFIVPPARDLNPAVSQQMADIIARATQLDPDNRYQSMLEMKRDLQALSGESKATRPATAPVSSATRPHAGPPPVPPTAKQPLVGVSATTAAGASPQAASGGAAATSSPPKGPPRRRVPVGLLAFVLLLVGGVTAGVMYPKLVSEGSTVLRQLVTRVLQRAVPREPRAAAIDIYRGGGSLAAAFARIQQARSAHPEDPLTLAWWSSLLALRTGRPTAVLALVYPRAKASSVLAGAAAAQRVLNSQGGVDGKLIVLAPIPYPPGGMGTTMAEAAAGAFGRKDTEGRRALPAGLVVWQTRGEKPRHVNRPTLVVSPGGGDLPAPGSGLARAVLSLSPTRVVWLATESAAALEKHGVTVQKPATPDPTLLQQKAVVVVQAARAKALLSGPSTATVVLVADRLAQLPSAPHGTLALVRFSSLSPSGYGAAFSRELSASRDESSKPPGARAGRAYDALLAAAFRQLASRQRFSGATVSVTGPGTAQPAPWCLFTESSQGWRFVRSSEVTSQ